MQTPTPLRNEGESLYKRWRMYWIEWKIIFQIFPIFSFWVIGRQRATHSIKKNGSKLAKFTGKIGIDLTMIFRTNDHPLIVHSRFWITGMNYQIWSTHSLWYWFFMYKHLTEYVFSKYLREWWKLSASRIDSMYHEYNISKCW